MIATRTMRRGLGIAVALSLVTVSAAACSSSKKSAATSAAGTTAAATTTSAAAGATTTAAAAGGGSIKKGLTVYFIPKDTQNPYEVLADKGGEDALKELGGKVVVSSGTADTAAAQIPSIQAAIQAHADAIVIAGNDPTALCPSLGRAVSAGIKVVSFDSDITCPNHLFINQANTEQIGTSEVDLLAKEIGSTGQIAILSAAASATNQNAWIGYMKNQLKKYPNMKLVSTVYGNDDPAKSLTVLQGLLSAYPNLKGIISPTTVGISTAAQYLSTHKNVQGHPDRARPAVADEAVHQGRHRHRVRAVEPVQPGLPGRLRRGQPGLRHDDAGHRVDVRRRQAGQVHDAGARRRHRHLGRARPADRVQQGQHRQLQLLIG